MTGLLALAIQIVYLTRMVETGAHDSKGPNRPMRATLWLLAAVIALLLPSGAVLAKHDGEFLFKVLRDGVEIGYHKVTLAQSNGQLEVAVAAEIEVKLAFLTLYSFKHERREVWSNGRLLGFAAKTQDGGETFDINIEHNGEGYTRNVNGRVDHLEQDRRLLAYWDMSIVDHKAFVSAQDGTILDVAFEDGGTRKLDWKGRQVETAYYRMTGDIERELWYDPSGHVLKLRMLRDGSEIVYLRQ
jgi:hypothetical protein